MASFCRPENWYANNTNEVLPPAIAMMCWSCSIILRDVEGNVGATATGDAKEWTIHFNILRFCQHYTDESHKSEEHLQNRQQDIGLT